MRILAVEAGYDAQGQELPDNTHPQVQGCFLAKKGEHTVSLFAFTGV